MPVILTDTPRLARMLMEEEREEKNEENGMIIKELRLLRELLTNKPMVAPTHPVGR